MNFISSASFTPQRAPILVVLVLVLLISAGAG
jgi:hypothetical protein